MTITEVVTRDGFQNEARTIPTAAKVALLKRLVEAGVTSIEVTSFVSRRRVPQLADAEEVMAAAPRRPGVVLSGLVGNLRGAERALAAGVDEVRVVVSASDSHNLANLNRTTAQSLAILADIAELVRSEGRLLAGGIATAFACPFEGPVAPGRLLRVAEAFAEAGAHMVNLADTTGMANPVQVGRACELVAERLEGVGVGLHLHDTRGMALANALAGLGAGVDRFDSSLGGIGGCPFAPGATGNVATEDLVHMLHEMGIDTGLDLDRLIELARELPALVGHPTDSHVARAGKASELHPFPQGAGRSRPAPE